MSTALIGMGVGIGLDLANSYFASELTKETAKLNQEIGEMNAEFAELDAYDARIQGETNKAKYKLNVDKTLSAQQAVMTASDIDVNYGSAAEIQKETRFIADINMMELERQAEERAMGYESQARGYRMNSFLEGSQAKMRSANIQRQGVMSAVNRGLSGYSQYKTNQLGNG